MSSPLPRHRLPSGTLIGPAIRATALARIDSDLDDLLPSWMTDLSAFSAILHPALLEHTQRTGLEFNRRLYWPD